MSVHGFDVRGRLVSALADGELPAGRHQLSWNGEGRPGVCFVQARAGAFSRYMRFMVIR